MWGMARLLRALRQLLGAAVLLSGAVCLAEVWLSARRAEARVEDSSETLSELVSGSRVCFLELRPLSRTSEPGAAEVRTNSFGLRGAEPMTPKPAGTFRVLVLGDEAVLGGEVPEEATFCAAAETLLEGRTRGRVEVINGGVPGGCPLTLSLLYRHRLAALNADAVILMINGGDVADDLRCRPYLRSAADGRPLACPHPTLGGTASRIEVWRDEFRLVDLAARGLMNGWVDHSPPVRSDLLCDRRCREWVTSPAGAWAGPVREAMRPVQWLREDVEATFATLTAVVLPGPEGVAAGWAEVSRTLETQGVRLVDPSESFAAGGAGMFETDGAGEDGAAVRLSAAGRERAAYELAVLIAQMPGVAR